MYRCAVLCPVTDVYMSSFQRLKVLPAYLPPSFQQSVVQMLYPMLMVWCYFLTAACVQSKRWYWLIRGGEILSFFLLRPQGDTLHWLWWNLVHMSQLTFLFKILPCQCWNGVQGPKTAFSVRFFSFPLSFLFLFLSTFSLFHSLIIIIIMSGGVLVWIELQTCICPSWCHCHSLSLASVKSRLVLPFWYRLTGVVPEKGPLNGCAVLI